MPSSLYSLQFSGQKRLGLSLVGLAYATAPFYKALGPDGSPVTGTDLLLVAGLLLLLPRAMRGHVSVAPAYLLSVIVLASIGTLSSLLSTAPLVSLITLLQLLICVFVLPLVLIAVAPSRRLVNVWASAFVAGHVAHTVCALALGPDAVGRYQGLTPHPNFLAAAGMMATALLLHLYSTTRHRVLCLAAGLVSLLSVYLSGGRAAALVVAGLVLLIPLVERSTLAVIATFLLLAAGVAGTRLLVFEPAQGSAIYRLGGGGTAEGSDLQRGENLRYGWERFVDHPITGSGLVDLAPVHNNYLEVAIAMGVVGLVAYVAMLWSMARGLLSTSWGSRLCYTVVAYAAYAATTPSFTDRTIWLALALSVTVFRGYRDPPDARSTTEVPRTAFPDGRLLGALGGQRVVKP